MIRSRPFNAVFAALFVLHIVVVGSGVAMGMVEGGTMQGMQMAAPSMSASIEAEELAAHPSESDDVPYSDGMPCEMPGMPNACPLALLCYSGTSLPAQSERLLVAPARDLRPTPLAVRALHAHLSRPELPPPRA